jgi:hypothetical protein
MSRCCTSPRRRAGVAKLGFVFLVVVLAGCGRPPVAVAPTAAPSTQSPTPPPTTTPTPTASLTPTASPTATLPAPTATPTVTPTPTPTPDAVATLTAAGEPALLESHLSPDRRWRVDIVAYPCGRVGASAGEAQVEQAILVEVATGSEAVVQSQVASCGQGLGAAGLEGLFWSPDSRLFYYTNARDGVPDGGGGACWEPPLLALNVERLTVAPIAGIWARSPAGDQLAFGEGRDLVLQDLDGHHAARTPLHDPDAALCRILWSPAGEAIYYLQAAVPGEPGPFSLVLADPTSSNPTLLLEGTGAAFVDAEWETGSRIDISGIQVGARRTWSVNLECRDFGRPALVVRTDPAQPGAAFALMLASPDGAERCLLHTSTALTTFAGSCQVAGDAIRCWSAEERLLRVLHARSGALTSVTPDFELDEDPPSFRISPDGTQIAWALCRADDEAGTRCRIYVTRADGSRQRLVLEEVHDELVHIIPVTWTPFGDALFFTRQPGDVSQGHTVNPPLRGRYNNLIRLSLGSGDLHNADLPDTSGCTFCIADITPDGRWLAYHGDDGALLLLDRIFARTTPIADTAGSCYLGGARLSPDGSHLAYVEMEGDCADGSFDTARTVQVAVPFTGSRELLSEAAGTVDWPSDWLNGETPVLERVPGGAGAAGIWVAGGLGDAGAAAGDMLGGRLLGVLPEVASQP